MGGHPALAGSFGPIKPLQITTSSTIHIVYTEKQILLQQAIKCDDVLRVGRSDYSLRSDFFYQHLFNTAFLLVSKIRLSRRRVEDVEGKNEEKGWGPFFVFF